MTNEEHMIAYRRTHDGLNPGSADLRQRLIPGMLALGFAALGCLVETGNTHLARIRSLSAAALKRTLMSKAPRFDLLRDDLAVLARHELECRGETYKPRGVVEVAHAWAVMQGDCADEAAS